MEYRKCSKEERGRKKWNKEQQTENRNTGDIHSTLSIIILNVNGLNLSQRHSLSDWTKKPEDHTICYLQEIHFKYKDTDVKSK